MDKNEIISLVQELVVIKEPTFDLAGISDDNAETGRECANHLDSDFLDFLKDGGHLSPIVFSA